MYTHSNQKTIYHFVLYFDKNKVDFREKKSIEIQIKVRNQF